MYRNYGEFWGMHWIWWILLIIFIIWVFATPWDIPGQRSKKISLDILKVPLKKFLLVMLGAIATCIYRDCFILAISNNLI